jgi:hypothetical protein
VPQTTVKDKRLSFRVLIPSAIQSMRLLISEAEQSLMMPRSGGGGVCIKSKQVAGAGNFFFEKKNKAGSAGSEIIIKKAENVYLAVDSGNLQA